MNWPMKVVPAVWLGLFGLFALRAGFVDQELSAPWSSIILGVQDPPGFAHLPHGIPETLTVALLKKGRELREHATKRVFREHKPLLGMAREDAARYPTPLSPYRVL